MSNPLLAYARRGDRYGYVNVSGEWVIEPRYVGASAFHRETGLAQAHDGKKWGFIDKAGAWRIEPKFDGLYDFFPGGKIARAEIAREWGLIDNGGRWLATPAFQKIEAPLPHLQLYPAADIQFRWGLIDSTGAWKLEPRFKSVSGSPAADTIIVTEYGTTSVGALTRSGDQWIGSPLPSNPTDKELELSFVGDESSRRWGVKNRQGEWVIKPEYSTLQALKDGCGFVASILEPPGWFNDRGARTNYGVLDRRGEWIIGPTFGWIGHFDATTGLAAASTTDTGKMGARRKYGFIDRRGQWAVHPRFVECRDFWDGTGIAKASDLTGASPEPLQWGLVNRHGEWCSPMFDRMRDFDPASRLIAIELGRKQGFLGVDGRVAIQPQFDDADTKFS